MPTADDLLGHKVVVNLVESLRVATPSNTFSAMDSASFELGGLTLSQRVNLVADALLEDVPGGFAPLAQTVVAARDGEPALDGWMIWPVTVALAKRAVWQGTPEALDGALDMLESLTARLSGEFAIRILLRADLHRCLRATQRWAISGDEHVRRLASEGTRKYLPWALRVPELAEHSGITMPILDALYNDDSEYVRRSVANHLNDLSRDTPQSVLDAAARWLQSPGPHTGWVVRHGLRTLVKQGNAQALALLGYSGPDVVVEDFQVVTNEVAFPGTLRFTATIRNDGAEPARIAVDYVVFHLRANGTQSPKTFKLANKDLAPGEEFLVTRDHVFREITTRRYYPGVQAVALQVNGQQTQPASFELTGL